MSTPSESAMKVACKDMADCIRRGGRRSWYDYVRVSGPVDPVLFERFGVLNQELVSEGRASYRKIKTK